MNFFDRGIIHFLNSFSGRFPLFDHSVAQISGNSFLNGGVMVALFWWAWNAKSESQTKRREYLLFGLIASVGAVFCARFLALSLPFRLRPMHNPALDFRVPIGMNPDNLLGWSAFPSDHASLFFCFATGLWIVSKRLGSIAFAYALFVIAFPLMYLGAHQPTDIIAGAILGIGLSCLSNVEWLRKGITAPLLRWSDAYSGPFYAGLFLCSFEIAELFDSVRKIGFTAYRDLETFLRTLR